MMQAIQSAGYILGAALAAVIYPVAGITAMIVLDVLGALFASLAVLAAQIDAGGLDEADRSLSFPIRFESSSLRFRTATS
ncbi:MAG: hypothetical protein ACLU0O_08985 [Collinsella sp.]